MHKKGSRSLDGLERIYKEEWPQIPFSVLYNLIRCYRRSAVIFNMHNVMCCFIGKGRMYKVLNVGVPIILGQGFYFLRINVFQLKVGFFSLFQYEIKLIKQIVNFL